MYVCFTIMILEVRDHPSSLSRFRVPLQVLTYSAFRCSVKLWGTQWQTSTVTSFSYLILCIAEDSMLNPFVSFGKYRDYPQLIFFKWSTHFLKLQLTRVFLCVLHPGKSFDLYDEILQTI